MRPTTPVRLLAIVAASVLISGCTAATVPQQVELTPECIASLAVLADVEPGESAAEERAIVASTTACTTVEEYLLGVEDNPASWWYADAKFVRDNAATLIQSACNPDSTTPMCQDAKRLGYRT